MKKFLTELAEKKGWTLPQLAKQLNIPYSTVYGYDNNDRKMSREFVPYAAKALGISEAELRRLEEQPNEEKYAEVCVYLASDFAKVLSSELLEEIIANLGQRLPRADEATTSQIMAALQIITAEKIRRQQAVSSSKVESKAAQMQAEAAADIERARGERARVVPGGRPAEEVPGGKKSGAGDRG